MNKIKQFTDAYKVTDYEASKILGVCPANVSEWRSGKRELPKYISNSIDLHLSISESHKKRIKDYRL